MLFSAMIDAVQRDTKIMIAAASLITFPLVVEYIDHLQQARIKPRQAALVHGITDAEGKLVAGVNGFAGFDSKLLGYPLHPFDQRPQFILHYTVGLRDPERLRRMPSWRPNDQMVQEKIIYFDNLRRGMERITCAQYAKMLGIVS